MYKVRGGRPACLLYRPRPINTNYSISKLTLYADNPDIVRERSGCSSRSLVPDTQLVAQLAGNLLDRGQGRGTVQATL